MFCTKNWLFSLNCINYFILLSLRFRVANRVLHIRFPDDEQFRNLSFFLFSTRRPQRIHFSSANIPTVKFLLIAFHQFRNLLSRATTFFVTMISQYFFRSLTREVLLRYTYFVQKAAEEKKNALNGSNIYDLRSLSITTHSILRAQLVTSSRFGLSIVRFNNKYQRQQQQ